VKTLTAKHLGGGTWEFTCPLHEQTAEWIEVTSHNAVLRSMKQHMDEEHPGVKVRILVKDAYDIHTTYTATQTVQTGDLL
jgi:hypothetical protein